MKCWAAADPTYSPVLPHSANYQCTIDCLLLGNYQLL